LTQSLGGVDDQVEAVLLDERAELRGELGDVGAVLGREHAQGRHLAELDEDVVALADELLAAR
jgi:hypothetical protein